MLPLTFPFMLKINWYLPFANSHFHLFSSYIFSPIKPFKFCLCGFRGVVVPLFYIFLCFDPHVICLCLQSMGDVRYSSINHFVSLFLMPFLQEFLEVQHHLNFLSFIQAFQVGGFHHIYIWGKVYGAVPKFVISYYFVIIRW